MRHPSGRDRAGVPAALRDIGPISSLGLLAAALRRPAGARAGGGARAGHPFIFVSGTIGEERAIDALRSGATDYVLKGNLSRLGRPTERALREVALKAARARLRAAAHAIRKYASSACRAPIAC